MYMGLQKYHWPLLLSALLHIVILIVVSLLFENNIDNSIDKIPIRVSIVNSPKEQKFQKIILQELKSIKKNNPPEEKVLNFVFIKKNDLNENAKTLQAKNQIDNSSEANKEIVFLGPIAKKEVKSIDHLPSKMAKLSGINEKSIIGKNILKLEENIPANIRQLTKPDYPAISRKKGEEGRVVLLVEIASDGEVGEIDIINSSGYSRLDLAAIDAAKLSLYEPALEMEKPVRSKKEIAVTFKLDE